MQRWEYAQAYWEDEVTGWCVAEPAGEFVHDSGRQLIHVMKLMGELGWELVTATPSVEGEPWSFFFKRPLHG